MDILTGPYAEQMKTVLNAMPSEEQLPTHTDDIAFNNVSSNDIGLMLVGGFLAIGVPFADAKILASECLPFAVRKAGLFL